MRFLTLLPSLIFVLLIKTDLLAQNLSDGLVASYSFNGNANDDSGNGNNGIVYDAIPADDRCGIPENAYSFDGYNSQIIIKNSAMLDTVSRVSLCAWIKPVAFTGVGSNSIIDKAYDVHESPNYQYHLAITGIDYPNFPSTFSFYISLDYQITRVIAGTWNPGFWYFVVGTYDGISLKLYTNGVLVDSLYNPGVLNHFGNDIYIGNFRNVPNAFTPGIIDDIKIYNRAISADEVMQLYDINCELVEINGPLEVCQGQQAVNYFMQPLDSAASYQWNYSGTGGIITGSTNNVLIDFAGNATSGNLAVTVTKNNGKTLSTSIQVLVNSVPSKPFNIAGASNICLGQNNISFSVPAIENASGYLWNYSGTGATIFGNSENITISFGDNATSGNLTVTGYNLCGYGASSDAFQITVNECREINGLLEVCQGQQGVSYLIEPVNNAISYQWSYSGTGVIITGNTNNVVIDFTNNATSGNLTVVVVKENSSVFSTTLPVLVDSIPSKSLSVFGANTICKGQNGISYSIPAIENATGYMWNYSGTGATIFGNSENITISFGDNATSGNLTVTGYNSCGYGVTSDAFPIMVDECNESPSDLNIPNSFSPNGDDINDIFFIRGLKENSTFIVFNRSGNKLFESSDYQNDWDGKDMKGHILESGTYWYVLIMPGIPTEFKGFIYLKK